MSRNVAPGAALGVVWYLLLLLAPWDTGAPEQIQHFFKGQGGGILSLLNLFSGDNLRRGHGLSGLDARLGIVSALVALALLAALAAGTRSRLALTALRPLALLLVVLTTLHVIQAERVAPDAYTVGVAAWAAIPLSILVATATLAMPRRPS